MAVLAAYFCRADRVLIITPSVTISKQTLVQFTPEKREDINPVQNRPFLFARNILNGEIDRDPRTWAPHSLCALKSSRELQNIEQYDLIIANAHKFSDDRTPNRGINIDEINPDLFSLVIVDEAHHYPAETWRRLVFHFQDRKIIFLTATPYNAGIYILERKLPCYTYSMENAIADGIIRRTRFIDNTQDAGFERREQIRGVLQLVRNTLERHDQQDNDHRHKAMILATDQEEARNIATMWNDGADNRECLTFVGGDPIQNVNTFQNPISNVRVLVVIYRLTEGFDCRNVSVAAILRNVQPQSRVYFAQFVGRAVRKLHPDDPVEATVISHQVHNQRQNHIALFTNNLTVAEVDPDDLD